MTSAVTFNFKALNAIVEKEAERVTLPLARKIAKTQFENAKLKMMEQVEEHEISKELSNPSRYPSSQFIQSPTGKPKNLYGFLGFVDGTDPVKELIDIIDDNYRINLQVRLENMKYYFNFQYLTPRQLEKLCPLDWSSRSWLKAVENGLASISKYISRTTKPIGRSSYGLQIKNDLKNPGRYIATPYMTPIIKAFEAQLRFAKNSPIFATSNAGQTYYNIRDSKGRFT